MAVREQRLTLRCDLCGPSAKPGYLWLGGSDYVECPQCRGVGAKAGQLEVVERYVQPARIFIPAPRPLSTVTAP